MNKKRYRSEFEKNIGNLFKNNKIKFEYEPFKLSYLIQADYEPDFVLPNGIIIEAKGWFKPADRRKMKAVKEANPDLDIRLWFMQDNYLTKSKKKRYSDWAKQHNFPYHIGLTLPLDWIQEEVKTKKKWKKKKKH